MTQTRRPRTPKPDPIAEQFKALHQRLSEITEIVGELAGLFEVKGQAEREAARKENLPDILHHKRMALYLGLSDDALRRRRARGLIPVQIYQCIDGRYYYSRSRYDAWIEGLLPGAPRPRNKSISGR